MRDVAGRRLVAVAGGLCLVLLGAALVTIEKRRAVLASEVEWLRTRLAERREQIARQQEAMAAVTGAVDRLARAALATREQAHEARRLARLAPARKTAPAVAEPGPMPVGLLVPDETAHVVEKLGWLEEQVTATGESVGVIAALLEERSKRGLRGSVPSVWPVHGLVTSRFGSRRSPWGDGVEHHGGIDIHAGYGAPVAATGDGEVIFAGRDPGYGALVIVSHPGEIRTLYAHLSAIYVREGQRVRRGQTLGAVGATGRATGPHLHYEVRVAGDPVDPRRYLN